LFRTLLAWLDDDPCPPDEESADRAGGEPAAFAVFADSAYGTGQARAALAAAGHTVL
jgi:hypothetical protein